MRVALDVLARGTAEDGDDLAAKGNADAMARVGETYRDGSGVEKGEKEAAKGVRKAARAGDG